MKQRATGSADSTKSTDTTPNTEACYLRNDLEDAIKARDYWEARTDKLVAQNLAKRNENEELKAQLEAVREMNENLRQQLNRMEERYEDARSDARHWESRYENLSDGSYL